MQQKHVILSFKVKAVHYCSPKKFQKAQPLLGRRTLYRSDLYVFIYLKHALIQSRLGVQH